MIAINRILHPSDFSDNSNHALKYACTLAEYFKAELHLLNVVVEPLVSVSPPIGGFLPADYYQNIVEQAEKNLQNLVNENVQSDLKTVQETVSGTPFLEIVRYSRNHNIDMLVMGTHGYTGIKHLIMGSVAENVVRKAPCPVLTVHADDHEFVMP